MTNKPPIILAIDTDDLNLALQWLEATHDSIYAYKLGLEFFTTFGADGVRKLREVSDAELFLDLKLHDIPNTVAGAVHLVVQLSPRFLTVHASGGRAMVAAAVAAAPMIEIAAVTVLTSLSERDLNEIGFARSPVDIAVKLALLAQASGARAVVCSPHEISALRMAIGEAMVIITPGIRPREEIGQDDQSRTMTPREAIASGANYLVIGRPITRHWNSGAGVMRDRAAAIADGMSGI
jgi:orotidine-5'-phosphate decarboxylase